MKGVLIGAGQLGSRHLQAMAAMPGLREVAVVEPQALSRAQALARWEQIEGHGKKRLRFAQIEALKAEAAPELAVIATLSSHRLAALKGALALGAKTILCEKILFQSVADYRHALAAVKEAKAQVRVNHVGRYTPVYGMIREALARNPAPLSIGIESGDIGMGCNLIHYLDLLEFLSGRATRSLDCRIDKPLLACKRGGGFIEFTGQAAAETTEGDRFSMRCKSGSHALPVIDLRFGKRHIVVDEGADRWREGRASHPLHMPRVSDLTARILPEMLAGATLLPTLEESFSVNRLMLGSFNQSLYEKHDDDTLCPIT